MWLENIKNFILIPYKILILPDYEDYKIPRFRLRTNKQDRIDITLTNAKGRLLDIGCGRYNSAIRQYRNGYGIDVYPWEGIDILCDTTKIPFKDKTFDTVSFIASFNHVQPKKINFVLQEVHRILKENNLLLITNTHPLIGFFNHAVFHRFDDIDRKFRGIDKNEVYGYSHGKLVSLLISNHFLFIKRIPFLYGLSYLYIFKKADTYDLRSRRQDGHYSQNF